MTNIQSALELDFQSLGYREYNIGNIYIHQLQFCHDGASKMNVLPWDFQKMLM